MNIIIVCGGRSVEEQISIITAIKVYKSLLSSTEYHPYLVYQDPEDFNFYGGQAVLTLENYINKHNFKRGIFVKRKGKNYFKLGHKKILFDLVFPIVHGANTEDGTMASYFITLGFPTLTPPLSASAICQDKILFKDIVNLMKIKSAKAKSLGHQKYLEEGFNLKAFAHRLKFPLIIKPYDLGSSIGISYVETFENLEEELNKSFTYSDYVLIEEYLTEKEEINIALIKDDQNKYHFSELEKIKTEDNSFYSYEEKYINGKIIKEFPYSPSKEELNQIQDIAINLYERLKLAGVVRYDFIKSNGEIFINEVNTIPGNYAINLFLSKGYSIKTLIDIYIKSRLKNIQSINTKFIHNKKINELTESNKFKL